MASASFCGCYYFPAAPSTYLNPPRHYLPQVETGAHASILSTVSRTRITQTFANYTPSNIADVRYTFPLYDGISVVSFRCTIGDKTILGVVKEKNEARTHYNQAVSRGEIAGLLEQTHQASDVFTTNIGNIPQSEKAVIEIEYVGELRYDAQSDAVRFTIPTSIAPRYGPSPYSVFSGLLPVNGSVTDGKIVFVVDAEVDDDTHVEALSSPSHPIAVTIGKTSTQKDAFKSNRASAILSLNGTELSKDFVVILKAQYHGTPKALIETHPGISHHRALMTTLVPKFDLPNTHPEVVFIVDRSGSMHGKIPLLIEAMKVFLKSLPLSAKFNICSFGGFHTLMFPNSVPYDERTLQSALFEVDHFNANYGGTEMLQPIKHVISNRLPGVPLEIMVLTDGQIRNQQQVFDLVNDAAKADVRLFSLGIGNGVSTSLVEGIARAGNGFAQFVHDNESMDKRVVRMLRAALSPHITDYHLELVYDNPKSAGHDDDGFVHIESTSGNTIDLPILTKKHKQPAAISLFDTNYEEPNTDQPIGRYEHLPTINIPDELQAPHKIGGLFSFNRVSAYVLIPKSKRIIKSVVLRGSYHNTPVQLEIDVQDVGIGKTIHQLAAKKAMLEIEEGRGWLSSSVSDDGMTLKARYTADWDRMVEREAVRLGTTFEIAGKFCSFVAVEINPDQQQKVLEEPAMEFERNPQTQSMNPFGQTSRRVQPYRDSGGASGVPLSTAAFGSVNYSSGPTEHVPCNVFNKSVSGGLFGNSSSQPASVAHMRSVRNNASAGPFGNVSRPFENVPPGSISSSNAPASGFGSTARFGAASTPSSLFGNSASGGSFGHIPGPLNNLVPGGISSNHAPASIFGRMAGFGATSPPSSLFGNNASGGPFDRDRRNTAVNSDATSGQQQNNDIETKSISAFNFSQPSYSTSSPNQASSFSTSNGAVNSPDFANTSDKLDTTTSKVHALISLLRFDGSWSVTDELLHLTGVWKADFDDASITLKTEDAVNDVKATIMAIAWLEQQAGGDREIWELIAEKSKAWVAARCSVAGETVDSAIMRAVAIFFP